MTITLEAVKAKQTELADMIAKLEAHAQIEASFPIEVTFPPLHVGEKWAGVVMPPEGKPYHLILLPTELASGNWKRALEWAAEIGGDLPDQVEAAMLHQYLRSEFQEALYWTNTTYRHNSESAFYQSFYYGNQYDGRKSFELRARAVRRLVIE